MLKEFFLGAYRKMHLPSPGDLCELINKAGPGCYLYSTDIARVYRQLPFDPADWPLVCFAFQGAFYSDISLPFGLHCTMSHFQDVTNMIVRELTRQVAHFLNYICNFRGIADDEATASIHFHHF